MIESKVWGTTLCVSKNALSEVHYLEIVSGGYCSEHRHVKKWNKFIVTDGLLKVTIFNTKDFGPDMCYIIGPGESLDVKPGDFHRFDALEDTNCIEVYWVEDVLSTDIERRTQGGLYDGDNNTSESQ